MLKIFKRYFIYSVLFVLIRRFRNLSLQKGRSFFSILIHILLPFTRKEQHIITANLSYTAIHIENERKFFRKVLRNMGYTLFEFIRFAYQDINTTRRQIKVHGEEKLDKALNRGKGVILITGHIGNWELLAAYFRSRGIKANAIYRRPVSEYNDRLIRKLRQKNGINLIDNSNALKGSLERLRKGEVLIILADQKPKQDSLKIDFLGRPADTPRGPAVFALKSKAALVTGFVVRKGKTFDLYLDNIKIPEKGGLKKKIEGILIAMNGKYSDIIRKYPDQWVWFHDRWGLF
ncbi:MAG: lysophospholipid acyltransferase family protein [Candidatus Muiribacteriaceae bacterium]